MILVKKIPLPNHIRPLMEVGIKLAIQLPSQIYELKKKKKSLKGKIKRKREERWSIKPGSWEERCLKVKAEAIRFKIFRAYYCVFTA